MPATIAERADHGLGETDDELAGPTGVVSGAVKVRSVECRQLAGCDSITASCRDICAACVPKFVRCDQCGQYSRDARTVFDGSQACGECVATRYWRCADCMSLIDDGDYCSDCDGPCSCGDCYECGYAPACEDPLIHDYDFKPPPRFHGDGPTYFGLELEINAEDKDDDARTAARCLGDLGYLKADSSIDYGFEIVTHPMSYAWAMGNFPWQMLDKLREAGCGTDGASTGLHVHISRDAFSAPSHIYRWMKFLYRNADTVGVVARRVSHEWARFDNGDRERVMEFVKGAKSSRHKAINTQNEHTFELRVFASSLVAQEVQAALGLAAASVEYTRNLTVRDISRNHAWQWSSFVTWLSGKREYAPLAAELEVLACAC